MRFRRAALAVLFAFCAVMTLRGFTFEPISQDFDSSGDGANRTFRVDNAGTEKIAVKISVLTRGVDSDGNETNEDASNLFMIYPKRVILEGNTFKTIRVKWKGPQNLETEQAFRIVAEQVPVEFDPPQGTSGGGIRLAFKYIGNIFVLPQKLYSEVSVKTAELSVRDGIKYLELLFVNTGTSHTLLKDLSVSLVQDTGTIILEQDDLHGILGENILAGSERLFRIPRPEGLGDGKIQTEITYTHTR